MPKVIMAYSGKVGGLPRFLQGMLPENVILISAFKQRKTTSAKVAPRNTQCKVVPFILPESCA